MTDTYQRVSVVGLGKLGLCLAGCLAERGFETLGVDIEERVVKLVNQGRAPWFEPSLDDLLARNAGGRLRATSEHAEAIENSDVTIVLVATPSNPDGSFSNRLIEAALIPLAEAFGRSEKPYHSFVISSTVMPGSTEEFFIPMIEKYSGRKLHRHFSVCYDPDFVALGNAIKGFLEPDLVVIGQTDPDAGVRMEALHHRMCKNEPAISRMSIVSAELAKVCLNAYITVKISFANSIANICERIPGADVDGITKAIGTDRRISPYYFQGGLSFGGTCFPRDTHAYATLAQKHDVQSELVDAAKRVNRLQDEHFAEIVLRELSLVENKAVGVLGLAFTTRTPVITESPAIKLIQELLRHDVRVVVSDPLAIDNTRSQFGSAIEYLESPERCLEQCGVAVVTLREKALAQAVESFHPKAPLTVIDAWRMIGPAKLASGIRYVGLGRCTPVPDVPLQVAKAAASQK
jgi:UDPglucose 6-dehydrogenase